MSAHTILLESLDDPGRPLQRTVSVVNDDKTEAWLQDFIFTRPEILPVQAFDTSISGLLPLARELSTDAGPIDDLFLTPEGRLVIVETKLWKNPEKHRTVVAQVIDYAKEISRWSYDELDQAVLHASRNRKDAEPNSLTQILKAHLAKTDGNLAEFQESIIENIKFGRFLLLIVGDQISPNVALLGEAIHGAPGLDFQLGLVELCMYPLNQGQPWPLLISAEIVGRTVEYRRAVVTVRYSQEKPEVDVRLPEEEQESRPAGKTSLQAILDEMPSDIAPIFDAAVTRWHEEGHFIFLGSSGMTFRFIHKSEPDTAIQVYDNSIAVYRPDDFEYEHDYPDGIIENYLETVRMVAAAQRIIAQRKRYVYYDDITAEDFATLLNAALDLARTVAD